MTFPEPRILAIEDVVLEASEPLVSMFALSPYVWRARDFEIMIRAVNRSDDPTRRIARIYYGNSQDGLTFAMRDEPAITPGPGDDDPDGCEDPTVILHDGQIFVFYTGWNQSRERGELMLAAGSSPDELRKVKTVLPSSQRWKNPKEAVVVRREDGAWNQFFEYATEDASRIGSGESSDLMAEWKAEADPVDVRAGSWDDWHLSPGPVVDCGGLPLMFYNGGTRDAKWRIGWILFDPSYSTILARSSDPLVTPPEPAGEDSDIAFAASAVRVDDRIWLYYSVADKLMKRATLVLG